MDIQITVGSTVADVQRVRPPTPHVGSHQQIEQTPQSLRSFARVMKRTAEAKNGGDVIGGEARLNRRLHRRDREAGRVIPLGVGRVSDRRKSQQHLADPDLIQVPQHALGDGNAVDHRPIAAAEIADDPLPFRPRDQLCMTPGNGGVIDCQIGGRRSADERLLLNCEGLRIRPGDHFHIGGDDSPRRHGRSIAECWKMEKSQTDHACRWFGKTTGKPEWCGKGRSRRTSGSLEKRPAKNTPQRT